MSTVSGLDNSTLLSLLANAAGTATSSSDEQSGTESTSSSYLDIQDAVKLTNKESLLKNLLGSLSSADESCSSLLENATILKAVEKADLFSTNPNLAEALTGISAGGAETTSSTDSSDLSSYIDSLDSDSLGSLLDLLA